MKTFRCPVDDCVFDTDNVDRAPTMQGHPECPGPECEAKRDAGVFKNWDTSAVAKPVAAAAPVSKAGSAATGSSSSPLQPAPVGQGW